MRQWILALGAVVIVGATWTRAAGDIPSWAYGNPPLAPGEVPAPARPYTPPAAPVPAAGAAGRAPDPAPLRVEGSNQTFTRTEINYGYGPADWFPEDHPPMPEPVAHGKNPQQRACGLCHMPNGKGRPENAPVSGQSPEYVLQQLNDFRNDLRHSADPRKENTAEMIAIAKALTEEDMKEVAKYFAAIKWTPWIRVVEADTIPKMRLQGNIFYKVDDGTTEPLGKRIVETPEDTVQTQLRNPRSGFIAYVPPGSLKKGEELATTGGNGKTIPCTTCHGPDLLGVGPIPGIAGRSPSYLARQLYDLQQGTRHGTMAVLMKPVVEKLTEEDLIAIVAYVSSKKP